MSVSYKRTLSTGQLKCPNCGQDVIVADWKGEGNFDTTNLGIGGSFSWKCHWCKADGYLDFWAPWHELVMMDGDFNEEYTWKWSGSETSSNRKPAARKTSPKRKTASKNTSKTRR